MSFGAVNNDLLLLPDVGLGRQIGQPVGNGRTALEKVAMSANETKPKRKRGKMDVMKPLFFRHPNASDAEIYQMMAEAGWETTEKSVEGFHNDCLHTLACAAIEGVFKNGVVDKKRFPDLHTSVAKKVARITARKAVNN